MGLVCYVSLPASLVTLKPFWWWILCQCKLLKQTENKTNYLIDMNRFFLSMHKVVILAAVTSSCFFCARVYCCTFSTVEANDLISLLLSNTLCGITLRTTKNEFSCVITARKHFYRTTIVTMASSDGSNMHYVLLESCWEVIYKKTRWLLRDYFRRWLNFCYSSNCVMTVDYITMLNSGKTFMEFRKKTAECLF